MYSINFDGTIIRDADRASIPSDPGNADYQTYIAWVSAGNVATPYSAPAQTWASFREQAQSALDSTDITVYRIAEAVALGLNAWSAADVVAWMNYRRSLRAIISQDTGTPGALPAKPPYPQGT